MSTCRHCGDPLDAPPTITSCLAFARWHAQQRGDMLHHDDADALTLLAGMCELSVALAQGAETLPDLPA